MSENIENIVADTLMSLGISPNTKGFHYLRMAVSMYVTEHGGDIRVTKIIYPRIAAVYSTSPTAVERAVRHSVRSNWHKRDLTLASSIFRNSLQSDSDIPSNSLFITAVGEWLNRELSE